MFYDFKQSLTVMQTFVRKIVSSTKTVKHALGAPDTNKT